MILEKIKRSKTKKSGVVRILHPDTPASLTIKGSDVTGLPSDYVIEPGSVLITPAKTYICFSVSASGSTFIEKQ